MKYLDFIMYAPDYFSVVVIREVTINIYPLGQVTSTISNPISKYAVDVLKD
ncbi:MULTISPECIES: hypothetical protein [unclassified Granulicatella]|uniref:hypothetical protein n=1 Tax=unclassified Granulicatella TaxID=2630493 RepID=UPI00142F806D|nr:MULTISPECIES: hypothetical protein [unclassified Granulicatella]MBF0780539.1 hypothetical protein [Granulicatella sp. 19428wC4_WM01]